jgi:hypothetical protein
VKKWIILAAFLALLPCAISANTVEAGNLQPLPATAMQYAANTMDETYGIGYDPGNSMLENALIENVNSFAFAASQALASSNYAMNDLNESALFAQKLETRARVAHDAVFARIFPLAFNTLVDSFGGMANPALAVSGLTTDNSCIGQTAGYSAYVLLDPTDVGPRYLVTALKLPQQFASVIGEVIFAGTLTA